MSVHVNHTNLDLRGRLHYKHQHQEIESLVLNLLWQDGHAHWPAVFQSDCLGFRQQLSGWHLAIVVLNVDSPGWKKAKKKNRSFTHSPSPCQLFEVSPSPGQKDWFSDASSRFTQAHNCRLRRVLSPQTYAQAVQPYRLRSQISTQKCCDGAC